MDGMTYYASLAVVVLIAIYFFLGGHILLSFLTLGVGAWLVYSHEEGVKLKDVREGIVKKIDEGTKSEYKSVHQKVRDRNMAPELQDVKTDESPQTDQKKTEQKKSEVRQADVKQTREYAVEKSAPAEEKPKHKESRVYDYGSGYDR